MRPNRPPERLQTHDSSAGMGNGQPPDALQESRGPPHHQTKKLLQPNSTPPRPVMNRSVMAGHLSSTAPGEHKFFVKNLPPGWSTRDVHRLMAGQGSVTRIEISNPRSNHHQTSAWVTLMFCKSPEALVSRGMQMDYRGRSRHVRFDAIGLRPHGDPSNREKIRVGVETLVVGAAQDENTILALEETNRTDSTPIVLSLDVKHQCLEINFYVEFEDNETNEKAHSTFVMRLNFPQITSVGRVKDSGSGKEMFAIKMSAPPLVFRKATFMDSTHEDNLDLWTEEQAMIRQTCIRSSGANLEQPTELRVDDCVVDVGRWLVYGLEFSYNTASSMAYKELCEALAEHNLLSDDNAVPTFVSTSKDEVWEGFEQISSTMMPKLASASSAMADLHQMQQQGIELSFEVRYMLEACLSYNVIHETKVDAAFLTKLANIEPKRACKLLEAALDKGDEDRKHTFHRPVDIFRILPKISLSAHKIPKYCSQIRSAIVTPTTIYFNAPVLETSNRVVRHFIQYEDRFLRVKFSDERYKGRIYAGEGDQMSEVFARIKRTMMNGIKVGDRVYEFLAFGNSQFREGGAYFFASTPACTAAEIRNWMGDFTEISSVAKYCSRLGQSFSTTRATPIRISIERLDDIERGKYNFSDGVGKISPFLAQMIAQQYGLPGSTTEYPSTFQFRLAGCKGVLTVDPGLSPNTIKIRPSQEKYPAAHRGLEICRISQFSAANLNVQLILVLSALGVSDNVFLEKMRTMLKDLEQAMTDEYKALELLQKNVDFNHMTIKLAEIVQDGFMHVQDPFVISVLHLWRSWSIKYLKEKARIFVEEGAFVLGCVDETASLRGHFNDALSLAQLSKSKSLESLPQIFIQVPDQDNKGKWKVITGPCVVARNPSLHPGDVRVVEAVDEPKLHHIKNCVVFPQTGDRDVPNMLSGGDLDGDDFIVMWDPEILPEEWNHDPMDYTGPETRKSNGPVTVDDMTSFFIEHMRYDNLARIAVAHRYIADDSQEGIKDPKCIELAHLHSAAVDFQKTGVPAMFPRRLRPQKWPHWSEAKNRRTYVSQKIIGKLYDEAKHAPFNAAWDISFDARVLNAYEHREDTMTAASEVKEQYDSAVLRLMAKFGIRSEFEVWSTFVMQHNNDIGDYKFAETIGEAVIALKDHHRSLCYSAAGTTREKCDYDKMYPFIAAMYTVTAEETAAALKECEERKMVGENSVPKREKQFSSMPFISFPWLFPEDLGKIAKKQGNPTTVAGLAVTRPKKQQKTAAASTTKTILGEDFELAPLPEIGTQEGPVRRGEVLDLFHKDETMDLIRHESLHPSPSESLISSVRVSRLASPLSSMSQTPSLTEAGSDTKTPSTPSNGTLEENDAQPEISECRHSDNGIEDLQNLQSPPENQTGEPEHHIDAPDTDISSVPAIEVARMSLVPSDGNGQSQLEEPPGADEMGIVSSSKPGASMDQFDALFDDDDDTDDE